jgi:hypothetical protein
MNTQVVGLAEHAKALNFAAQATAVLKDMRILDEGFDPAQANNVNDYVSSMGDRLYAHAYNFPSECIDSDGDYAALFCALVQHAGLVKEFTDVESSLDRDSGIASIRCGSGSVTFSSQWQQVSSNVEDEFLSFTNATFDAAGGRMHVQLPRRNQDTSMICVSSHHYVALDAMLRVVDSLR